MGTEGIVFINDLSDLKSLCCICLARNEQMMNLYDSLEDQQEPDVSRIYDLLCKVMMTKVIKIKRRCSFYLSVYFFRYLT